MQDKKRILLLLAIMASISVGIGAIVLISLYRTSFAQQRTRLVEIVRNQARTIEAMARSHKARAANNASEEPLAVTLRELRDAQRHFEGFGKTGEFTLAKREGDQIVFLLRHRHHDLGNPYPVPFASKLAEPMRMALSGKSGTLVGLDYRGEKVLAAFEPAAELNLGVVAKIDMAEIRAPFIKTGLLAGGSGLVLILFGTALFLRIGNPMVQRLGENERKYRGIFESAADMLLLVHRDGTVLDANPAACLAYGISRGEFVGQSVQEIVHQEHRKFFDSASKEAMEGKVVSAESVHLRKDGTPFPAEVRLSPMAHKGETAMLVAVHDISNRKRAEEALRESEGRYRRLSESLDREVKRKVEELRQAEEMAAMGRMVSIVSHEVRNPLQNIRMGVEALHKEIGEDNNKQEILEEINYGVNVLNEIIEQLLEYSKPLKLQHSSLQVSELVQNAVKALSHRLDSITVHKELELEERRISVDSIKIGEVLVNLLSNALEAMPKGGDVWIRSTSSDIGGADYLKLSVSDNGCGIREDHLEQIWEPFFTTKTKGTGLGLPICKKIVDAHGGKLEVKSKLNEGTTVEITLPLSSI